jgi:Domain of unknown function (DUF5667)
MRSVFRAARSAERFEALVGAPRTPADRAPTGETRLLALVDLLRSVPAPEIRGDFVVDLRARLMAEADTVLLPTPAPDREDRLGAVTVPVRPRSVRDRRVAALLSTAAVVGATGTLALSAQAAIPGDSLYPVKRVLESAQAELVRGEDEKGELLLAKAALRLDEVEELLARDTWESRDATAATLQTFSEQSDDAATLLIANHEETGREESVVALREFTGESMARLQALSELVPPEAADELAAAGDQLLLIDSLATQACPSCEGEGVTEFPTFLASAAQLPGTTTYETEGVTFAAPPPGPLPRGKGGSPRGVDDVTEVPVPTQPSSTASPTASAADPTPASTATTATAGATTVAGPTQVPDPAVPTPTAGTRTQAPTGTPAPPPSTAAATPTTLIDDVKTILVGSQAPSPSGSTSTSAEPSSGGVVGTVGAVLETVTTEVLGEEVGQAVGQVVNGLGQTVGALLGGNRPTPPGRP